MVANDVDKKRAYMLVHQTLKRMKNAITVVICEDATRLPDIKGKVQVLMAEALSAVGITVEIHLRWGLSTP